MTSKHMTSKRLILYKQMATDKHISHARSLYVVKNLDVHESSGNEAVNKTRVLKYFAPIHYPFQIRKYNREQLYFTTITLDPCPLVGRWQLGRCSNSRVPF